MICFALALLSFVGASPVAMAGQSASPAAAAFDTDPVMHDLCGKSVALLGESPVHGFGKTLEFKGELVRRLVDECHYSALFIESGTYDFIKIEEKLKAGQDVTDPTISAAIGGLWANKEVQSLIPFLSEKLKTGKLILGGLDDQINRGTYAEHEMPLDLVRSLQPDERSRCLAILQRHTLWQYTDETPYSPADKAKIIGCLDEVEALTSPLNKVMAPGDADTRTMADSLKRNLARNFTEDDFTKIDQAVKWNNDRDRSMYLNFKGWQSRLPPHTKIIVWAATVHLAKDVSGVSGSSGGVPLGSYLRQDFGDRAFSLGFSAFSGSYAFTHQPVVQLTVAPADSLEGRAFADPSSEVVYLTREQLRALGPVAARPLGTSFKTARWDSVFDGLIVFRQERPPRRLDSNR